MKPAIRIRPARSEDSADILRWRNHPLARKISFQSGRIGVRQHEAWFKQKLADSRCRIFIIEEELRRLGQIRLDGSASSTAIVSIALDPVAQGKGVGLTVLKQIEGKARKELGTRRLVANIKPANAGSLILFLKAGFIIQRVRQKDGSACCVLQKELYSRR